MNNMPYIDKEARPHLLNGIFSPSNAGELNFLITNTIIAYLKNKGENYQTYNDIIGALEGCKLELYARKVRAYEEKKCTINGDVY